MEFRRSLRRHKYEGRSARAAAAEAEGLIRDTEMIRRLRAAGFRGKMSDLHEVADEESSGGWPFSPEWHHVGSRYREARYFTPRATEEPFFSELLRLAMEVADERRSVHQAHRSRWSIRPSVEVPGRYDVCYADPSFAEVSRVYRNNTPERASELLAQVRRKP